MVQIDHQVGHIIDGGKSNENGDVGKYCQNTIKAYQQDEDAFVFFCNLDRPACLRIHIYTIVFLPDDTASVRRTCEITYPQRNGQYTEEKNSKDRLARNSY